MPTNMFTCFIRGTVFPYVSPERISMYRHGPMQHVAFRHDQMFWISGFMLVCFVAGKNEWQGVGRLPLASWVASRLEAGADRVERRQEGGRPGMGNNGMEWWVAWLAWGG